MNKERTGNMKELIKNMYSLKEDTASNDEIRNRLLSGGFRKLAEMAAVRTKAGSKKTPLPKREILG